MLSEPARAEGMAWNAYVAFEEDCDMLITLWELPCVREYFKQSDMGPTYESLSYWHPDYLRAVGIPPNPEIVARRKAFDAKYASEAVA